MGAAGALLAALAPGMPVSAAPGGPTVDVQGESRPSKDRDQRGRSAPTAAQRDAATEKGLTARFGALGTPSLLVHPEGRPLATGLPADPEAAARAYLSRERALLGLSEQQVASLERVAVNPVGKGAAVLLRQDFGDLRTAQEGLVSVGVVDGEVLSVTSSLTRGTATPQPARLSEDEAEAVARRHSGVEDAEATTELVALPVVEGARSAYEVVLLGGEHDEGVTVFVDAVDGSVLLSDDLLDHADDGPSWEVFPANPPADYGSADTRVTWCADAGPGCEEVVDDPASPHDWDQEADGTLTSTSNGNSARTGETRSDSTGRAVPTRLSAPSPTRTYGSTWTNQWYEQGCDPETLTSPQEADLEAAMTNLFASHNRLHDWSYDLGFTETAWNMQDDNFGRPGLGGDAENGNAQAGAFNPNIRDNANQATPRDGLQPRSNMYMWQPIAGAFYAPCVDGDYDMSVIGHEYTHAISNRMVAGPDAGLSGPQAGAMGESWSDLVATEYLREYGYRAAGDTATVIGAYVTGDAATGIRNYDMSRSPLNYTDIGYDLTGPQVHADGEIWSATNHALREALVARYGAGDAATNRACAEGERSYETCPGSRRWVQLVFDSFLLMAQSRVSMVDAKDALLAAEAMRGGADQALLRRVFASRGFGVSASSATNADPDPVASFAAGDAGDAAVRFVAAGDGAGEPVRFYVGDHEARAVPVADNDPSTSLGDRVVMTPGTYRGLAVGPTIGHQRFVFEVTGVPRSIAVPVVRNLAASASGATATGDGVNAEKLIDGTEGTNWAVLNAPVEGKGVTVDLAGTEARTVRRVQVSAALRPAQPGTADPLGQNRYTALRQFRVLACDATTGTDCADPASFATVYTSPADAFPAGRPRPTVVDLQLRSFDVPETRATHLRLEAVTSQCTGGPDYQGEQDQDPRSRTDCDTASAAGDDVRAAEFQVLGR